MPRPALAHRRLANQRLIAPARSKPEEVVGWLGAVQAQDYAGVKWTIGQRVKGATDASIERALDDGSIVRTHVLRPTWHLVLPGDLRWMQKLSAPRVHAASSYYYRKNELDGRTFARSEVLLRRALEGGRYSTRAELANALVAGGIDVSGLRLALLMMHAELEAIVCSGPRRGKQFTYALVDERVPEPKPLSRERALVELTVRYFRSHGPALPQDFAWWSGLTAADVKLGLELASGALSNEVIEGRRHWFAALERRSPRAEPSIHLLPNYDEYLIAYKDRGVAIAPETVRALGSRGGVLSSHVVLREGKVIGGWRRSLGNEDVTVETRLLTKLDRTGEDALRAAIERYGRFLGTEATWQRRAR